MRESTKKGSVPWGPNSGNARASAALITCGVPPASSRGTSTAVNRTAAATPPNAARRTSILRPRTAESASTPTARTPAGG